MCHQDETFSGSVRLHLPFPGIARGPPPITEVDCTFPQRPSESVITWVRADEAERAIAFESRVGVFRPHLRLCPMMFDVMPGLRRRCRLRGRGRQIKGGQRDNANECCHFHAILRVTRWRQGDSTAFSESAPPITLGVPLIPIGHYIGPALAATLTAHTRAERRDGEIGRQVIDIDDDLMSAIKIRAMHDHRARTILAHVAQAHGSDRRLHGTRLSPARRT